MTLLTTNDAPLVSVITATYRAAGCLRRCIESVRAQTYAPVEHIVIDGGSDDGTVDLLESCSGALAGWISEPDTGVYDAWNKGLALARGEWIAFLGADDVYLPSAIEDYMSLAAMHPEAMYLSSQVRWTAAGGASRIIGEPWSWPRFQRRMCTAHVGSMHRRSLFESYGRYDTTFRCVADYEFLLRAGADLRTAFLPQVTAEMQGGGLSDSAHALDEAARAKRTTGMVPWQVVAFDHAIAKAAFFRRRIAA
jgi:glycosyltransferase involved in cell wall biosynthesis